MLAEKALARIGPKMAQLKERTGATFGALEWTDVVWALSKLEDPLQVLLLRVKWGQEQTRFPALKSLVSGMVHKKFKVQGWRVQKETTVERLVDLLLWESIFLVDYCPTCQGRCSIRIAPDAVIVCDQCAGTGQRKVSGRKRAAAIGVHEKSWRKVWSARHQLLTEWLQEVEQNGLERVTLYLDRLFDDKRGMA